MAEIKNIEDLLTPILGEDKKYVGMKTGRLTMAGDNYGSMLWGVEITVKNQQGQAENVRAVAKMLPKNEFVQKAFNSQVTFRNEVGFYKTIAPLMRNFQEEHGLQELYDSFPAYYGARLSLDPRSKRVDEDAVLLIKNIKDEGFVNVDRTVGFDFEQTKLILEKLAELHATFMAFKSQKRDLFDTEVSQYFEEFKIFDFDTDSVGAKTVMQSIINIIKDDELCTKHMDKIKGVLELNNKGGYAKNKNAHKNEPFYSFVHGDMWSNNIMIKIADGKPVGVKFVDYQIYEYYSLTKDVIFFLFTSVQLPVIRQYCDDLLSFYHKNLIQWLTKFKYNCSDITFEAFIENIKKDLHETEFFHIMLMLPPIYAKSEDATDVEEMNENELAQGREVSKECKEKGCFIVREFLRRDWL